MNNIGMYTGVKTIAPDQFIGSVAITGNSTSNPTVFSGSLKRAISTVARTAEGKYTITFASGFTFPEVPHVWFQVFGATGVRLHVHVVQEFLNSDRTLKIEVSDHSDSLPIDLATTEKLYMMLVGKLNSGR